MDNHRPITLSNSREPHLVPIASLKPYDRHLRRHSKAKIEKLKKLVVHFGQVTPIIVDENNVIIDGHALHSAMRELGAGEIAVISIAGRSVADIRALRLALNRLPQEAAWDNESLRTELQELVDLSFDLDLTGFNAPEIDQILELDLPALNVGEDESEIPPVAEVAVSACCDIWQCSHHRLGCGDALDKTFIGSVLAGAKADVCFIDPPYNVPIAGFVSGKGRVQHREFVQATGEMSSGQFTAFLAKALTVLKASSTPGALVYACMDWAARIRASQRRPSNRAGAF
jgi:hypothetical protein